MRIDISRMGCLYIFESRRNEGTKTTVDRARNGMKEDV